MRAVSFTDLFPEELSSVDGLPAEVHSEVLGDVCPEGARTADQDYATD